MTKSLKNKTRKDTKIKFYKIMFVPIVMFGSKSWIMKEKDKNKLEVTKMRLLRR